MSTLEMKALMPLMALAFAVLPAQSAVITQAQNPARDYRAEDRVILSSLLADSCRHAGAAFAFLESATPAAMLASIHRSATHNILSPYREPLLSLFRRNAVSRPLPSGLACAAVKIAPRSVIDQALAKGWEGTQLTLSLPGYSERGDRAIVYEGDKCGNGLRCGGGYFIELRKADGRWTEDARIEAWFS
jgi:hypothetical protein